MINFFQNKIFFSRKVFLFAAAIIMISGFFVAPPSAFAIILSANPTTPVLNSADNYVILAKTAVTTTGTTAVTGNIGISPAASSFITGFSLVIDSSTAFSTSDLVTGNVYASDYLGGTTSVDLTTAIGDMETAYTNIAGMVDPTPTNELGAGNIGGMTLTRGIYKWSTDVTIPTNVTLSGSASDVWIFQIAGDLSIASAKNVILSGGALASNVFWQVGGPTGATLETYSTFNGIILTAKQVIIQTGAVLNGRALAQTQVTLDANTVSISDTAPVLTGPVFIDTNVNGARNSGELSFATIQEAIDAASSGDTIVADAGTYAEDLSILSSKTNLEIIGTGSSTIKGVGTNLVANYPQVVSNIEILASGVKLHGFIIEAPDYSMLTYSSGMLIGAADVEIYNNTFKVGAYSDGNTAMSNGIQSWSALNIPGVDISGLNIHDNTFTSLSAEAAGYEGIYLNLDAGTGTSTIQNNTFTGSIFRGITTERSRTNIIGNTITNDLSPSSAGYSGTGGWQGINIGGANAGAIDSILVSGNTVQGSSSSNGFTYGIKLGYTTGSTFSNVSLINNSIHNSGISEIWTKISAAGITLSNNDLSGTTGNGIENSDISTALNATQNWWGSSSSTTIATLISGPVNYNPWYTDAGMTTLEATTTPDINGYPTVTLTNEITATISTSAGAVSVIIPDGTIITGPMGWDGTITLPVVTSAYTLTPDSGFTASMVSAIEIGAGDLHLTFNQAVKLTFTGLAGKLVGWSQAGVFYQITAACDSLTNPTLGAGADCKIDDSGDLIIWTMHFSAFITYTQAVIPPSGGGGGGGSVPLSTTDAYADWLAQKAAEQTPTSPWLPQILGEKVYTQLEQILIDAAAIWTENINIILGNVNAVRNLSAEQLTADKYLSDLTHNQINLLPADINRLNWFITYGTLSTKILGAGERAGVLNSYKSAFGKLPRTEAEWQDVIKIANGRWPSERSTTAESKAKVSFEKIYGRNANMNNTNDDAAVTIMAYGLRPSTRNLNSERIAIVSFKYFIKYMPVSAIDWDMVRAIAYSGSKR